MQLSNRRFFGLLGEVVDGNPTQEMMEAAFHAADLPWSYISMPVTPENFASAFQATRTLGFAGLHITKPYKIVAVDLVDDLTPAAAAIGAVNCTYSRDGVLIGDNTDGRGLANAVGERRSFAGASVVVLGAGGAGRAVAVEIALLGASEVVIVDRTRAAGESLADAVRTASGTDCRFVEWAGQYRVGPDVDVLVNATSVGMEDPEERPDVDFDRLGSNAIVADVVIASKPTRFLKDAGDRGLTVVAGSEMLTKQAAISFERWTGMTADEGVLGRALSASFVN